MLKNASCNGKWQMEDGKAQRQPLFSIYHLPFSIQAVVSQRPVRAAYEEDRVLASGAQMDERIRPLVEKIWNYHRLHHELSHADAILGLCSHDTVVAERAAQLFLDGWAPLLIFAGGLGVITRHLWSEPEADQFARIAIGMGVPEDRILIENRSTNTGENVLFTRRMLAARGIEPHRFILVQKPYMERRTYATFRKMWPGPEAIVTSPQISLDDYLARYSHETFSPDDVISIMVGDLQRIRVYPEKGFQIPQEIPPDVWASYEELVRAGYNRHLIAEAPEAGR
jgi:uncharacterized SAM-binding protein YcdF (DUF218 family)